MDIALRLHTDRQTKRVCCVSLNFPPSSVASVHRVRHLAKHLPAFGWRPTIICIDERDLSEPLDWRLADLVPPGVVVRKIRGVSLPLSGHLGFPIWDYGHTCRCGESENIARRRSLSCCLYDWRAILSDVACKLRQTTFWRAGRS